MASTYKASCHCGGIQIEITAELSEVVECNCSVCRRSGFLHWYVQPEQVRLRRQDGVFPLMLGALSQAVSTSANVRNSHSSNFNRISTADLNQRTVPRRC
jgi:hypothetical protein